MTQILQQPDLSQKTYFFCGIGGSGMSALAMLVQAQGHIVYGSDRSYDQGKNLERFEFLRQSGFVLFPQDGSGLTDDVDYLVVSSAVEDRIPDVKVAKDKNIPIIKRAELLSASFNDKQGIAIGGTSGKTTVTAMTGCVFDFAGTSPNIVNGGLMNNFIDQTGQPQNTLIGNGDYFIAEVDESDGSIALFNPVVAILNNLALDHKPLEELRVIFAQYLERATKGCVLNFDNGEVLGLRSHAAGQLIGYSVSDADRAHFYARNIRYTETGSCFDVVQSDTGQQIHTILHVPGLHNISNALAAICCAYICGISVDIACKALEGFKGTHRRLEFVGQKDGVSVIDDFAHNPDKIAASLSALKQHEGRLLLVFQPHGFGPTKMLREGLVESFVSGMNEDDILYMPEIYYAGGTANKVISSQDIIDDVNAKGRQGIFCDTRADIIPLIQAEKKSGDRIVVMGARDDTLTHFCHEFLV